MNSNSVIDNVLILAGGSGTRLWPASTRQVPKQFMSVGQGKTLLRLTIERAAALSPRRIMIVTLASQADQAAAELGLFKKEAIGDVPELLVLGEPAARNTAPAIASGVACCTSMGSENETVLVLPADHVIRPIESFVGNVSAAEEIARAGYIVTFGVPPTRPETGYGYIEAGDDLPGQSAFGRHVSCFREKPDLETAEEFVKAGNFTWNSGMFLFTIRAFAAELAAYAPEVSTLYNRLKGIAVEADSAKIADVRRVFESSEVAACYGSAPKISVDYAVMEKTTRAAVLCTAFEWNDIGSWDEYSRLFPQESPAAVQSDGTDNFVLSDIPVSIVGADDLMVVIKNGRALICRKGMSQGVKDNLEKLPEEWR